MNRRPGTAALRSPARRETASRVTADPTMKSNDSANGSPRRKLKLGVLRDNLGYLSRLARSIATQSRGEFVDDLGFATGQITLLGLIAANAGISQNDLARALLMRKSQVTALIQDLVVRGLVERTEAGNDRRFNALSLTKAGTQAWRQGRERFQRHSERLQGGLDPAERQELVRLLRKLIATNMPDANLDFDE